MKEFIFGTLSTTERRLAYFQQYHRGIRHHSRLEPVAPGPGDAPLITVTVAMERPVERVICRLSQPEIAVYDLQPGTTHWDLFNWAYYREWQVSLPARPAGTLVRYTIEAHLQDGSVIPADDGQTFSYLSGDPQPPDWATRAIIYQILPDRFHPGRGRTWEPANDLDDIHGGTLRGIIDHLDYIADLGFNCIWLNPFFPDETHHGYHATDYFTVNPRLGSEADLCELVSAAHQRGIRLLLDFVANHWGRQHYTFQEALADRDSEYHDWYNWSDWPDEYETFFGVRELPQVNVDHPAARQYLLDAARHWLIDYDFDGFRLDYALGPSLDFWTEFREVVKAAKPEAWIFGEVVETPTTQLAYWGRLDGCLDFLLQQALRNTFAFGDMTLGAFDAFLRRHEAFFPAAYSRPSFLDNHDVNRFLWLVNGDRRKLKLAALCQFTLSGPPIVYYGTEAGLSQERDIVWPDGRHIMAEARQPMVWSQDQDQELHDYYRHLVHLRRQHPALWHGSRQTLHLDEAAGTYAYSRSDKNETLIVAFNLSDQPQAFTAGGQQFELAAWSGDVRVS
jgi:cyclomaltodextrinase / maltogenic alpha-amylase / neopullulanase